MTFKIEFTDLAKGFATKVGGLNAVEEQVRGEVSELLVENELDITDLIMHVVMMKDSNGEVVDFVCSPSNDGSLVVDTATYEEMGKPMSEGPFKGMPIMFPQGDTDD